MVPSSLIPRLPIGTARTDTVAAQGVLAWAQALQEAYPQSPWSLTFSYGRALQSATLKVPAPHLHTPEHPGLDLQRPALIDWQPP